MKGSEAANAGVVEILADLQHDLGKHLAMPVAYLPAHAPEQDWRAALQQALFATRRRGDQVVSARQLWQAALREGGEDLQNCAGFDALRAAVERALSWEASAMGDAKVDRVAALAELRAVGPAIRRCLDALRGDA